MLINLGLISWFFWRRIYYVTKYLHQIGDIGKALDFGCGLGILLPQLKKYSRDVSGVDIFIKPAQDLQRKMHFEDVTLYNSLDECKQQTNDKFETIISLDVLEHMDDLEAQIIELLELLHDNGRIIISGTN